MNETCQKAENFLKELLADFHFDLSIFKQVTNEGCLFDFSGQDSSFLLNENGEMLDALEVLLFQIYGRDIERSQRFICDADGYRQTRRAELQAMARFAAQNVRKNGKSFTFGKLNSTERRIIHLSLVEETDLQTESIGEGRERRLQIRLK
ncbi:MAG: protein jag [Pyrinomonadaceae bacterium]